jgi:hypothetical protein
MKSRYLFQRIGTAVMGFALLLGVGMVSTANAQQWPWGRDQVYRRDRNRDRDRRDRNDRNNRGGYGNYGYQEARNRGYQDGLQTGANDASRRQSYDPQRSHYYRNATYGYDRSYGNKEQYKDVYRNAFVQGYNEGFRRYGGNRRGNNGRWPW